MQREIGTQMAEVQSDAGVSRESAPMDTEDEEFCLAPADLLRSVWVPSISVVRNVRLLISSVSMFANSQRTSTLDSGYLIDFLTEAAIVWLQQVAKNQDINSAECFELRIFRPEDVRRSANDNKTDKRGGGDVFLEEFKYTINHEGFPQFIVKQSSENLYALRSTGREGQQLVRIQWYNTKEIKNVDCIDWWRHALLRAQFVIEDEENDKGLKLRQVLDSVFNEMRKSPGVTKEVSACGVSAPQPGPSSLK